MLCPASLRRIPVDYRNEKEDPRIQVNMINRTIRMLLAFFLVGLAARAASLPAWDFRHLAETQDWSALHDCRLDGADPEAGLPVALTGADPYFAGPARDFPPDQALWLEVELKSDSGGGGQVFYFSANEGPSEERSVRFAVPAGRWQVVRIPLPALGPGTRLRLDPPGTRGTCFFRRLRFEPRLLLDLPPWPRPSRAPLLADAPRLRSGELELIHGPRLGAFELQVAGAVVAIGHNHALVGYLTDGGPRWLKLTNEASAVLQNGRLLVSTTATDADGAQWKIAQEFAPSPRAGAFEVETRVTTSQDRRVVFLPMLTLFPGVGSFGTNKTQGLLAGVEYLENEPSSSERDLIGPQARRQVPDSLKLTFPLMSVAADGRWVGLLWESSSRFAALHDSPDRIFQSGGSVLSILFPGSDPAFREDGNLLPYAGKLLPAQEPLVLQATLMGGSGTTVIPSVQEFVARRGLPALPSVVLPAKDYYRLAAQGWLDSAIREGDRFRHAVGPTFGSQPAADAAWYMEWLAGQVGDVGLSTRLTEQSVAALAVVPLPRRVGAQVGHVRYPLAPLVYGGVGENAAAARAEGQRLLGSFQPDGTLPYAPPADGPDFSSTHWSKEANGLAGMAVAQVLERGVFSGDRPLIREGLRLLRALDRFREGVPRGAQTWEVPLHTPDILASAALVRAYTLGYELTGDPAFLTQARYWAWTGVPFVYLTAPNDQPVGVYSTIAVLGATHWVAPNWIGLPVQWCGLAYADAIRRFARHDPAGPWIQLADGIALAGVQQTHPLEEPDQQGLLPDSFDLRAQLRNPVPINPATLLPLALQAYGAPPVYDFLALRRPGLLIHAPGLLQLIAERDESAQFRVEGWPQRPWNVVVNGLVREPQLKIDGRETALAAPHHYDPETGRLVLQLTGATEVELRSVGPGPRW